MDSRRQDAVREARRTGFSLVECVIVLGVVMIVVALMLPALAHSVSEGKLARDLTLMRSHAASIMMYTEANDEVFPYWAGHTNPTLAARSWYVPMMDAAYFASREEIEPDLHGSPYDTVTMSMCMVYDWRLMRPGKTVSEGEQVSAAIPMRAVEYPSLKGVVFRAYSGPPFDEATGLQTDAETFCCGRPWVFPVAMVDGSAEAGDYLRFNNDKPVESENGVGTPVWTTWLGVKGIDRW